MDTKDTEGDRGKPAYVRSSRCGIGPAGGAIMAPANCSCERTFHGESRRTLVHVFPGGLPLVARHADRAELRAVGRGGDRRGQPHRAASERQDRRRHGVVSRVGEGSAQGRRRRPRAHRGGTQDRPARSICFARPTTTTSASVSCSPRAKGSPPTSAAWTVFATPRN